jgi:hypothetical protein
MDKILRSQGKTLVGVTLSDTQGLSRLIEKINEIKKDPEFAPQPGQPFKKINKKVFHSYDFQYNKMGLSITYVVFLPL